jgi:hypothetical protein
MVYCERRPKIQIVRVHAKDSKNAAGRGKIASNNFFKIRNSPSAPIFDPLTFEKTHLLKDLDRRYNITSIENRSHRTVDPRVEFVTAIVV